MWEKYLREQLLLHPSMEPRDVMKFCFQASFGAEHLLRDMDAAWKYLKTEYEELKVDLESETDSGDAVKPVCDKETGSVSEPLYENISDTLCRVNLRTWKRKELPLEWLFSMFVKGAEEAATKNAEAKNADCMNIAGNTPGEFEGKENCAEPALVDILEEAEALIQEGILGFRIDAWQDYLSTYPVSEPVAVHHSEKYREVEKPAYRLVQRKYMRLLPILEALCAAGFCTGTAGRDAEAYIIAIDGRCASGKTTMAQMLADITGAGVVHMDDFFLPMELRTPERLQEPGGNVHYERVHAEVISHLSKTECFSYGKFDCSQMAIEGQRFVEAGNLRIVEGAYSCHPKFGKYMSLRVFSDVDASAQLERIKDRDGENALKAYRQRWIPMEEAYLEAYGIEAAADIVL